MKQATITIDLELFYTLVIIQEAEGEADIEDTIRYLTTIYYEKEEAK